MPAPPERHRPTEVWTVFGRWRRRSRPARRLGVALLLLALLLTLLWARTPRTPADDGSARSPAATTVARQGA